MSRRRSSAASIFRRARSPRRSSCSNSMARSPGTAVDTCGRRTRGSRTRSGSSGSWPPGGVELAQMQAYMRHDGCLMEFLATLLDDPAAAPCGRCSNDVGHGTAAGRWIRSGSQAAVSFLRRDLRTIKPRLDVAGRCRARAVRRDRRHRTRSAARCASTATRAGGGTSSAASTWTAGSVAELVVASARAIRDRWRPQPAPEWVTAMPSSVAAAARRRDSPGRWPRNFGLPYVDCLSVLDGAPTAERRCRTASSSFGTPSHKIGIAGRARARRARSSWSTTSWTRAGR